LLEEIATTTGGGVLVASFSYNILDGGNSHYIAQSANMHLQIMKSDKCPS